jgi:hypothetical protein
VEGVGAIEAKEFYSHCKVLGWGANRVTRWVCEKVPKM